MYNPTFSLKPITTELPYVFVLAACEYATRRDMERILTECGEEFLIRHPTVIRNGEPYSYIMWLDVAWDSARREHARRFGVIVTDDPNITGVKNSMGWQISWFGRITSCDTLEGAFALVDELFIKLNL